MLINYIKRAFIWSALYYSFIFFSIFYLHPKEAIQGWDGLLVFISLLFIGISTETMSQKKELNAKRLKPYSVLDVGAKICVFLLAECIYRKIISATLQYWFFTFIVMMCAFSIIMEIKMLLIIKNDK